MTFVIQHVDWQHAWVKGLNPKLSMNVYIFLCCVMVQELWILKFSLDFGCDQIF